MKVLNLVPCTWLLTMQHLCTCQVLEIIGKDDNLNCDYAQTEDPTNHISPPEIKVMCSQAGNGKKIINIWSESRFFQDRDPWPRCNGTSVQKERKVMDRLRNLATEV